MKENQLILLVFHFFIISLKLQRNLRCFLEFSFVFTFLNFPLFFGWFWLEITLKSLLKASLSFERASAGIGWCFWWSMTLSAHYRDSCQQACSYLYICERHPTRLKMALSAHYRESYQQGFLYLLFCPMKSCV